MLKRKNRLTSTYEFNKTRNLGKKYESRSFYIFYYEVAPDLDTRVGIVVSNKFHKAAVKRNRIKRLFSEVIRNNFDKINKGYWLVIHPKVNTLEKSYEEINADFVNSIQTLPFSK